MATIMQVKDSRRLSWLHPIDRLRARRAAHNLGSHMKANNRTTANVADFLSENRLAADAALLRSLGVIQLTRSLLPHVENGYLKALKVQEELPQVGRLAVVQLAPRDEDLPVMRTLATIREGRPEMVPVDQYFSDSLETVSYNMSLGPTATGYSANYYGPGRVVNAARPGEKIPLEGELSVLRAVLPRPLLMYDGQEVVGDSIEDPAYQAAIPDIIIKDETRPSTPLGLAAGGLMGAISFGKKRLYQLVVANARFLLSSVNEAVRQEYSVFLGKSNRYLRFFGRLTVGYQTLDEVTSGEKRPQFMVLTRPLDTEINENEPKQIALVDKGSGVDKASGKVKYILPAAFWGPHTINLLIKMGSKFGQGMRAREIVDAFNEATRALEDSERERELTVEEEEQLAALRSTTEQLDLWASEEDGDGELHPPTDWVFMEVVPGAFVAKKTWIDRLNNKLHELSQKYKGTNAGKELARVLRENGNLYNIDDIVYLAMFTSDKGGFIAGFVGKLAAKMPGMIDPAYLGDLYDTIRGKKEKSDEFGNVTQPAKGVFQGEKIYAINMGEAAEVISFSDEKHGLNGVKKGEFNFNRVISATVTYSRRLAEEWRYWRLVLGIPLSRIVVEGSQIHGLPWWRLITRFKHWWRRDLVAINQTSSANLIPAGPTYSISSNLQAARRVRTSGPLISIGSESQIGRGVSNNNYGLLLYGHSNVGPAVGEGTIDASGLYVTYKIQGPLPGSGLSANTGQLALPFPAMKQPYERVDRSVETDPGKIAERNKAINGAIPTLSPDATARFEAERLREVLRALGRRGV